MFIVIYQENTIEEIKHKEILILRKSCPATSDVVATFHPTIGQCAHQSLSNTATPELGTISTRNKGTLAGSHVSKDTQNSSKPTQLGLSTYTGARKVDC